MIAATAATTEDTKVIELLKALPATNTSHKRSELTHEITSKVAYLSGVRTSAFTPEDSRESSLSIEVYEQMNKLKPARIIRNLCIVRTAMERNFGPIYNAMKNQGASLLGMDEYIPMDSVKQLILDGITVFRKKKNQDPREHIIDLNHLIANRINNCKSFFPTWLNWDYIKELFLMPNGYTIDGIKAAADQYFSHLERYPYGVYLNWDPGNRGVINFFSSDKLFLEDLYEYHHDRFSKLDKVIQVTDSVTCTIYDFISDGENVVLIVDCENSDPYHLYAVFDTLDEKYLNKISKVVLIDDIHASSAWTDFERLSPIPVTHKLIERVANTKSLVDITLAMEIAKEFYSNTADSFILVSSDSDYWGVISALPNANFLVMVEHDKIGNSMKLALNERGIYYCFIDDFNSANSEKIKANAICREISTALANRLDFNFIDLLKEANQIARAGMSEIEMKQFFDRHIRSCQPAITSEGKLEIPFKF